MSSVRIPVFLSLLAGLLCFFLYLYLTGKDFETYMAEHAHAHVAPHGGTLIVLGDHLGHVEMLLDKESGRLSAYVLDGHAEHPVRLKEETLPLEIQAGAEGAWESVPLQGVANPLTGEALGDTSEFRGNAAQLAGKDRFALRLGPFTFRGVSIPRIETSYPEGNELGHDKPGSM